MTPGVYANLTFAEYQAIDAVNASVIVAASKTLAHALVEKEDTPGMRLGRAFHAFTLQPNVWRRDWATLPEGMTRRGQKWTDFQEANKGKDVLDAGEMENMKGMWESLNSGKYETARALMEGCDRRELTLVWIHRKYGCLCKARLDGFHSGLKIIVDLKTSTTADPEKWLNTTLRAGGMPHFQVGHYLQGTKEVLDPECKTFIWILFEVKPPYGISVVQAAPAAEGESDMAYLAEIQMEPILERYLEAKRTGKFTGYPDRVVSGTLPKWFMKSVTI